MARIAKFAIAAWKLWTLIKKKNKSLKRFDSIDTHRVNYINEIEGKISKFYFYIKFYHLSNFLYCIFYILFLNNFFIILNNH